jgi:hypothetical protein
MISISVCQSEPAVAQAERQISLSFACCLLKASKNIVNKLKKIGNNKV